MSGCENGLTTDPKHEDLGHGADDKPVPQNKCYLVLSDEERAKGFVRPVRSQLRARRHRGAEVSAARHHGRAGEELARRRPFVKFEPYPQPAQGLVHRALLDAERCSTRVGKGCGTLTTMGRALAETYARKPASTARPTAAAAHMHRPVGADGEFVWDGTDDAGGADDPANMMWMTVADGKKKDAVEMKLCRCMGTVR
jgi:hypothetical protein